MKCDKPHSSVLQYYWDPPGSDRHARYRDRYSTARTTVRSVPGERYRQGSNTPRLIPQHLTDTPHDTSKGRQPPTAFSPRLTDVSALEEKRTYSYLT